MKSKIAMFNLNSKSTFSAILLSLTLMVAAFWVSPAAAQKYVTDPSTGKVVTAPEYGGTITYPSTTVGVTADPFITGVYAQYVLQGVNEHLAGSDWATDRDVWDFSTNFSFAEDHPALTGSLAESWEQPDATTIIFHIRQGVNFALDANSEASRLVGGRELTADDVAYTFQRNLALGDFTERPPQTYNLIKLPWESIEAVDKYTVVFKLKEPTLGALTAILGELQAYILPPEVIEQYGDYADWRNVVGTGPFMVTDYVDAVSKTYTKNPDYWGYDEKYPQNRLPYVDEIRGLIMPEAAARISALRTGKLDIIHAHGGGTLVQNADIVRSLQRTNPEVQVTTGFARSLGSFNLNHRKPPFDDVRVRHALQMALDLETINKTYFGGLAKWEPMGSIGYAFPGYFIPFDEWPEELKGYYTYDPEGAEALLDAAGYKRGADGVRFKTTLQFRDVYDLGYAEIAAGYWAAIGVDVSINNLDTATWFSLLADHNYEMASGDLGFTIHPRQWYEEYTHNDPGRREWGGAMPSPEFDAIVEAFLAATTIEEQKRVGIEADMLIIKQHKNIWTPMAPIYHLNQPWLKGFNGEWILDLGLQPILARLWIDSELKEAKGY